MKTAAKQDSATKMALGQLYTNKVQDSALLDLFVNMPREAFVPATIKGAAYVDEDLNVAPNRTLLAPLTFARMIDEAKVQPSDNVLVIGCLHGYAAALLSRLAAKVTATETIGELVDVARSNLKLFGVHNASVEQVRNLADGYAQHAPYDVIFVAGAVDEIPHMLSGQLAPSGRLITIISGGRRPGTPISMGQAVLMNYASGVLNERVCFDVAAGLLPGFEAKKDFSL